MYAKEKSTSLLWGVISDFRFATLHAIVHAYKVFRKMYGHLYCAHFMKMVSKDVDQLSLNLIQNSIFKEIMAAAINLKNLQQFDKWFTHRTIVLKSNSYDEKVKISLTIVLQTCGLEMSGISIDEGNASPWVTKCLVRRQKKDIYCKLFL